MYKLSSSTEEWAIYDSARDTYNVMNKELRANTPGLTLAEYSDINTQVDFLSNGFKIRGNRAATNTNGALWKTLCHPSSPERDSFEVAVSPAFPTKQAAAHDFKRN